MVLYRTGTFSVVSTGASQTLNLGFVPTLFTATDISSTTTNGVDVYWDAGMASLAVPITLLTTWSSSTPTRAFLTTTGISAFQSSDANLYTPQQAPYTTTSGDRAYINQSTNQVIATTGNITNAAQAVVTTGDLHSFTTAADVGVTVVTFHGVPGMTQINGLSGVITAVGSTSTFTVNINTTNFGTYNSSGKTQGVNSGFFNVITGAPATTLYGNTNLPTAEANLGFIGITLGTGVVGASGVSNGHVFSYQAFAQSPVTGP